MLSFSLLLFVGFACFIVHCNYLVGLAKVPQPWFVAAMQLLAQTPLSPRSFIEWQSPFLCTAWAKAQPANLSQWPCLTYLFRLCFTRVLADLNAPKTILAQDFNLLRCHAFAFKKKTTNESSVHCGVSLMFCLAWSVAKKKQKTKTNSLA